jgi:quinol monooxygenase YgiN
MSQSIEVYLLSIRGKLSSKSLSAARNLHNETAGAPANVAAARELSDLSHMVYVPIGHNGQDAGDLLFLDQWNNLEGLNNFFGNVHVQEQAAQIFSARDPVVWRPAVDFNSYHFPSPYGKNQRFVGIVRGMVPSRQAAQKQHNDLTAKMLKRARAAGNLSHEAYFRLVQPGQPESLEFFAVDVWFDEVAMNAHYNDPDFMAGFSTMFTARPDSSIWVHPAGDWVEW